MVISPGHEPGFANLWLRLRFPRERSIRTDLTPSERLLLARLACRARRRGGAAFVEVGSYLGASASFISAGLRRAGGGGILTCVDTWRNDSMSEGARDTWKEFQANVRPWAELIRTVRATSVEAATSFAGRIDFLFIDADHDYEAVRADIRAWFPKLSPGATVAFHDVLYFPGVRRAVDEMVVPRAKASGGRPNLYWARL